MTEGIGEIVRALTVIVTDTKNQVDKMAQVILGDPIDLTKPGVMIRLDRLERSNRNRNKVTWIIATGLLLSVGNAVLSLI